MKELLPKIDSQDGQFHNGNPATGEQGTRVTDTWLNNVQAHLRDIGEELKFLLSKAGMTPIANKTTQIYDAIVAIINANRRNGSVSAKGEIQLTNDTGLDSEVLGLSAKGAKKLAQEIAQNRINVNNALANKVDKTAVSDAVNSDSQINVASSRAVKMAYDKAVDGVNRANNAQNTANNAQTKANQADNNANNRVAKSGDTMTGTLHINIPNSEYSAVHLYNKVNKKLVLESNPDSEAGTIGNIIYRDQNDRNTEAVLKLPKKNGTLATTDEVNTRVSKSGDVIQWLNIQREHAWLTINSMNYGDASVDFMLHNTRYSQVSLQAVDIGNYSDELRILTTPKGNNYESDRRRHTFTFNPEGHIWSLGYGWLHDYFVKKSGDRMTGDLEIKSGQYSSVRLLNNDDRSLRIESAPLSDSNFGALVYYNGGQLLNKLAIPKKSGTLATEEELNEKFNHSVTDVRLGAETSRILGDPEWRSHGAGYVVTGFRNTTGDFNGNDLVWLRPIQKQIRGQWITVANA